MSARRRWPSGPACQGFKHTKVVILDSELRSCAKVEVAVLGSPSLIVRIVSVDVKQQ